MDSVGGIIAAVLLAAVLVGGAAVGSLALQESAPEYDATESFNTSGVGSTYSVTEGPYYSNTVEVTNGTGETMAEETDYTWNDTSGTLTVESQSLANETGASIDYSYQEPTETQSQFAAYVGTLVQTGAFLPLVIIIGVVLVAAGVLGGLA